MVISQSRPRWLLFVRITALLYVAELSALHHIDPPAESAPLFSLAPVVDLLVLPLTIYIGRRRLLNMVFTGAATVILALLSLVEAACLHYLLIRWVKPTWHTAVWILTALSIYAAVWIVANYMAMVLRPHRIEGHHLYLRIGLLQSCEVPLSLIADAAVQRKAGGKMTACGWIPDRSIHLMAPPASECDVVIQLLEPVPITSGLGKSRMTRKIAMAVDARARFVAEIANRQTQKGS